MANIIITLNNDKKMEFKKGITLGEIIKEIGNDDIICGMSEGRIVNYNDCFNKNTKLYLYDVNTKQGNKIYEKGLLLLFEVCTKEILGKDVNVIVRFSIDKGVFCEVDRPISKDELSLIKRKMKEKVASRIPFEKLETTRIEAIEYFKRIKRIDKVKTLSFDTSSYVKLYKFEDFYEYILGDLPVDSSILKYFDLSLIEDKGVVVRFPSVYDDKKIIKYTHHNNYFNSLIDYTSWGNVLGINNLGELNEKIINNNAGEIVNLSEIMQDYKLLSIAERIVLDKENIKIVLLSGPSSSGKTTTAKKLSLYLKTLGLNPIAVSIDDYFVNREDTPLDENGNYDFECLGAVDLKLFDSQIAKLLKGSEVVTPTFDFVSGVKVFNKTMKLGKNDILVIEGLHALNDKVLDNIPRKNKFKIYVSPLTYLNIDNDNRISMTDIRLLRRMVRDNRTRGYKPEVTLKNWHSVRRGEEKWVFPYQDEADVLFNSSLSYELGALKTYVEPLLFSVKETDPEYQTAIRLLELLRFVLPVPTDDIPKISILREFIGGGYFE